MGFTGNILRAIPGAAWPGIVAAVNTESARRGLKPIVSKPVSAAMATTGSLSKPHAAIRDAAYNPKYAEASNLCRSWVNRLRFVDANTGFYDLSAHIDSVDEALTIPRLDAIEAALLPKGWAPGDPVPVGALPLFRANGNEFIGVMSGAALAFNGNYYGSFDAAVFDDFGSELVCGLGAGETDGKLVFVSTAPVCSTDMTGEEQFNSIVGFNTLKLGVRVHCSPLLVAPLLALAGGTGVANRPKHWNLNDCSPLSAEMFPEPDSGNVPLGGGHRSYANLSSIGNARADKVNVDYDILPRVLVG